MYANANGDVFSDVAKLVPRIFQLVYKSQNINHYFILYSLISSSTTSNKQPSNQLPPQIQICKTNKAKASATQPATLSSRKKFKSKLPSVQKRISRTRYVQSKHQLSPLLLNYILTASSHRSTTQAPQKTAHKPTSATPKAAATHQSCRRRFRKSCLRVQSALCRMRFMILAIRMESTVRSRYCMI